MQGTQTAPNQIETDVLGHHALSENAARVLYKRYLTKDKNGTVIETPTEMFHRVADAVAHVELSIEQPVIEVQSLYDDFYNLIASRRFLPNTPCLINAGRDGSDGTLHACYVLPIEDSIDGDEGIYGSLWNAAKIFKGGGGVGYSFSRLRPRGSVVQSSMGVASGPVSFMRLYDASCEAIKQGGVRRGAQMAILDVRHPDILEFIECKNEEGKITNFNISVGADDNFMHAVEVDEEYALYWPVDNYPTDRSKTIGVKHSKKLRARDVWNKIIHGAWLNGEPGVVFLDKINEDNILAHKEKIEATNPCVTGDTHILTKKGFVRIDRVANRSLSVWTGSRFENVTPTKNSDSEDICRIEFSDGSFLNCTPYHGFYLESGLKVEARELSVGDKLERFKYPVIENKDAIDLGEKLAYTLGVYAGDGSKHTERNRNSIWLYDEKQKLLPYLTYVYANKCEGSRIHVQLDEDEFDWDKGGFVPVNNYSIESKLDWLAGLLDTDAGFCDNGAYSIWSVNKRFLYKIKYMLATLGVGSVFSLGKSAAMKMMPDGKGGEKEYWTQDSWRLTISGTRISQLVDLGLNTHRVDVSYRPTRICDRYIKIEDIKPLKNKRAVYCYTSDSGHGMFGTVVTAQCGEQPLLPNEPCCLGSIDLAKFIKEDFESDTKNDIYLDYEELRKVTKLSVRFLDNMIDLSNYATPEIKAKAKYTRRIGLGVMGFAHMLYALKISYSSDKARDLGKLIMQRINVWAIEESVRLGKMRGYSEACWSVGIKRRNIAVTTIAPTGSISMIADTSYGIEPVFSLAFEKHVMEDDKGDKQTLAYIDPYLDKHIEDHSRRESILAAICDGFELEGFEKPDWLETTNDIPALIHVKMQAAFQEHTENGISKTINMPNEATELDVHDAYMMSWKLGCKGITVYRDGSRDVQVLTHGTGKKDSGNKIEDRADRSLPVSKTPHVTTINTTNVENALHELEGIGGDVGNEALKLYNRLREHFGDAPPSSQGKLIGKIEEENMSALVSRKETGEGKLYAAVTLDDDRPIEVFCTLGKAGGCSGAYMESIGRLCSLALRHGAQISEIVHQLRGVTCHKPCGYGENKVHSCPDALAQILQNVDKKTKIEYNGVSHEEAEGSRNVESAACPDCGAPSIEQVEGCQKCRLCGWSTC